MPEMPGDVVVRELRALRPELAVIMMSGYRAEDVADRYGDLRQVTFLQKPFSLSHLKVALRDALDEIQARRSPTD
ncbi:MAG TPA: response regulator, partial [Candidatus Nanopelagicales bacterium]|nr:response regulator [Candidatus Nanopelagicales bacterium]